MSGRGNISLGQPETVSVSDCRPGGISEIKSVLLITPRADGLVPAVTFKHIVYVSGSRVSAARICWGCMH